MADVLIYAMNYAPEWVGVGRCTAEIGAHLAAQGHDVFVVTTPPHYPEWRVRAPYARGRWCRERSGRQTIVRCPLVVREKMGGFWRLVAPLTFAASSAPIVFWEILRRRPGVVLCVEPTLIGAPALLLAAWLSGAMTVLHVQDLEVDAAFAVGHLPSLAWLKWAAFAFERLCLKRFDRLVTISNKMAERLAAKGVDEGKTEIVRNWVDLDSIRPLVGESPYRSELGFSASDKVVLYSGVLGAKMGFDTALEAVERLVSRQDIKFVIAGEGPAKAQIKAKAASLPNLISLDFQPEHRIGEFLGLADLHLLPQAADAADLVLPSKLGGMLASGRPIVATARSGTEIADFLGSCATLTPPGDGMALSKAIVDALDRCGEDAELVVRRLRLAALLSKTDGLRAIEAILMRPTRAAAASAAVAAVGAGEAAAR